MCLTPAGKAYNDVMASLRVSIENQYATVMNTWRYLNAGTKLLMGSMPVGKFFLVCSFLYNCRSIMAGNQVQSTFGYDARGDLTLLSYLHK
eukprot:3576062-Rhodomonas_salina.1